MMITARTNEPFGRQIWQPPKRKLAVVVMDMQLSLKDPNQTPIGYRYGTLPEGITRLCRVLECAKELGIPIVVVEMETGYGDRTAGWVRGYPQTLPEIQAIVGEYGRLSRVKKREVDAFESPDFHPALQELEVDTAILTGYRDSVCILETCISAIAHGFQVVVGRETLFKFRGDDKELRFRERTDEYGSIRWFETTDGLTGFMRRTPGGQEAFISGFGRSQ